MRIFEVPLTYNNLAVREETVSMTIGTSDVEVSIAPVPDTKEALLTILENGEPLMLNVISAVNEFVLRETAFPEGFVGDFIFLHSSIGVGTSTFDITRLGVDLFLLYVDGENNEN